MTELLEILRVILPSVTAGGLIAVFLLIYFVMFPQKVERWGALLLRLIYGLSSGYEFIRVRIDRRVVASNIQAQINTVCDRINKEAPEVLPNRIMIEWVKTETKEAFIKGGEVIVRLKAYRNQERNVVEGTLLYLRKGFLPRSKQYLDDTLRKGCEFTVASQIFVADRSTDAYGYFFDKELTPARQDDPRLERDMQTIQHLDSKGYFSRVFLVEVRQTGERLLGTMPTDEISAELRQFAHFLQTIATKSRDEDVPLTFLRVRIKVGVVLVAKREKIQYLGIEPYVQKVHWLVRRGCERIYISAWGKELSAWVMDIKRQVRGRSVNVLREYKVPIGGATTGILLVCQANNTYLARQRESREEVERTMAEVIPAVSNGEVKIVSVARIKGSGCKIAVMSSSIEADPGIAAKQCVGRHGECIEALKRKLKEPFVSIVPRYENDQVFVTMALKAGRDHEIAGLELDEQNRVAYATYETDDACAMACGWHHNKLKLACELTGYQIEVQGPSDHPQRMPTADQELRLKLFEHILEMRNDQIEIINTARLKSVGSRVVVRWKHARGRQRSPSEVCRGPNDQQLKEIQRVLSGEPLYFHDWHSDPKRMIVNCIYPIRNEAVDSVELDRQSMSATVRLKEIPAISKGLMRLAEDVTKWRIKLT